MVGPPAQSRKAASVGGRYLKASQPQRSPPFAACSPKAGNAVSSSSRAWFSAHWAPIPIRPIADHLDFVQDREIELVHVMNLRASSTAFVLLVVEFVPPTPWEQWSVRQQVISEGTRTSDKRNAKA
jgi:hypothetical protein